ncbi:DUF4350 domain-containing protein [Hymenobacter sp.]|uniref:DUF4350 domain-containing protein n=1 Tax=Hymenobacter sp. TaxID=1898978 RepID=UPI00286A47B0|nr:DUF4350 domain-containing protein [Hymenobacter sp.]
MPQLTTFRLYLLGIALLFAGYVALEYNRPKPLDWNPSYANKDKIPYGTYALYDQLPRLLGTDSVEAVRLPIYSQLTGLSLDDISEEDTDGEDEPAGGDSTEVAAASDSTAAAGADGATATTATGDTAATEEATGPAQTDGQETVGTNDAADAAGPQATDSSPAGSEAGQVASEADEAADEDDRDNRPTNMPLRSGQANYLFVNQGFELSRPDALALLQFVARGNDAFVAAQEFSGARGLLRDSLGFTVEDMDLVTHQSSKGLPVVDSVDLRFSNPALAGAGIRLPGTGAEQRLVVDSGRVGRTLATDARGRAVFIQLDYGRGHFYICTAPLAFTNYYLLRPRSTAFASAALTYLPARRTWWDEYQKQGPIGEQSLLRVVMAHDALRTAYYLILAGGLLFVLVEARRRQRIIPTLRPLPNTTLLFTRTVASLYRQGSSHALIAEKKVGLFMDYLRTRFQETNPDFGDADFRERLSQKSGLARPRVDELLRLVNFARTAPQMNDRELLLLSKALSDFKQEVNR